MGPAIARHADSGAARSQTGKRTRLSVASNRCRSKGSRRGLKTKKSRQGISAPRRLLNSNFLLVLRRARDRALANRHLAHPERIERRLVDRRCLSEPLVSLVGGERFAGQRPKQSIHFTLVITHLLQHGLHIGDHLIWRLSTVT